MRLNAKDIISGGLLLGVALLGLWFNQDHTLGTARRMGPGYMPMLTFWILVGLSVAIMVLGLFNGPDPLDRWTRLDVAMSIAGAIVGVGVAWVLTRSGGPLANGWYNFGLGCAAGFLVLAISPGWRKLGLVLAAFCVFGLSLDQGGLILTILLTVLVSVFADETQRVRGVLGLMAFLVALCWWVFIRELDIRVNVWPQFL